MNGKKAKAVRKNFLFCAAHPQFKKTKKQFKLWVRNNPHWRQV